MKTFYIFLISILSFELVYSQADTTNGTGGGNWLSPAAWQDGTVPTSGNIYIKAGDRLHVNTSVSVGEIIFEYRDTGFNLFWIQSGHTISCSSLTIIPTVSSGTSTLRIDGTLSISNGASNRNLIINGNPSYTNLDVNVEVNSGGQLLITDNFSFDAQSSSTDLTVTTTGKFQSKMFNTLFDVQDCNLFLNINGDFDYTTMSAQTQGDNSDITISLGASADVDGTGQSQFITSEVNNNVTINTTAGSTWNIPNNIIFVNFIKPGSNNALTANINGNISVQRFRFASGADNTTLNFTIGSTGNITTSQRFEFFGGGGSTTAGNFTFNLNNGGVLNVGDFFDLQTTQNGLYTLNINGTFSIFNDFRTVFRNNTSGTFDIAGTGNLTCSGFKLDHRGNGDVIFNNGGTFTCNGNFQALAMTNDNLVINFNNLGTVTGNYTQQNSGSGSIVNTNVTDELTVARLRYNILSGATAANNVMDIDNPNAILNVSAIDFLGIADGLLITGSGNNSTVNFKGTGSGDSIPTTSSVEYDNLQISNTSGIQLIGPLNAGNFFGDLTINTGGSLTLTNAMPGRITVQGDFTNNAGVIQNSAGSDFIVLGDYSNSGTHGNNTGKFYFSGDFNNTGTFQNLAGDTVFFNGPSGTQLISGTTSMTDLVASNDVTISSGMISIVNSISVTGSSVFNANGNMTLLSNASGTAFVTELGTGNSITGNVRVQRFLNEGVGYHMLGSPVTGATIAHWQNGIFTSGFTGATNPAGTPSIYTYNEASRTGSYTTGYVGATNVTNALTPTLGFMVYLQNSPGTVEVVGPIGQGNSNNTGPLTHTVGSVGTAEDGWHLRSNPYPSPVLWTDVTRNNILNNEGYVMQADGNYGALINDNIDILYSGEAFWVQTVNTVALKRVLFNEDDKVNANDDYNFRKKASPEFSLPLRMELTYSGKSNYLDYSVLRFGGDTNTVNFDKLLGEARKIGNARGTLPNISSWSYGDSSNVYYNGLNPMDSNFTIPLNVWTGSPTNASFNYSMNFNGIKSWVENGHCVILRDTVLNVSQKLDEANSSYSWTMNDSYSGLRFFLDHEIPVSFENIADASCYGYADGAAKVVALSGGSHTYTWKDASGNTVFTETTNTGSSTFEELAGGKYIVWVDNNGICGDIAVTIEIQQPEPIIADFTSDEDTIYMNTNSTIVFTNASVNAVDYFWDFGDGNTSNQENPSHTYIAGGNYTVKMAAIDDLCSDTIFKTIVVVDNVGIDNEILEKDQINVYRQHGQTIVDLMLDEMSNNVQINMYDIVGRSLINDVRLTDITERKYVLDVPSNLSGIYTITVNTDKERKSFKIYYE